ncbi:hypothetical protein [Chryseobacterium sp. IT-36CA2]|uniref:hypothetical protein n=1 Tax=Chryseobacterium sp. IT-36CA2 TaxID=3026460 RepID=UPI0039E13138
MKSLQQLKSILPFYKGASILLFIFSSISKINAQVFYYQGDTEVTILENTTLYVTDSGAVNEKRLKNFKGDAIISDKTEKHAFNRKSRSLVKRIKSTETPNISKERVKIEPQPVQQIISLPDNFFLTYQKGQAISALATPHDHPVFSTDYKELKLSYTYLNNDKNKVIRKNFIFCKGSYLFQYKTRPPPFEQI